MDIKMFLDNQSEIDSGNCFHSAAASGLLKNNYTFTGKVIFLQYSRADGDHFQ